MDEQVEEPVTKKRKPFKKATRVRPSILTEGDRERLEHKKKKEGHTLDDYNISIEEYMSRDDTYEALVLFSEMYGKNIKPNITTFTLLINGLLRLNRAEKALSLYRAMEPSGIIPNGDFYRNLLTEMKRIGEVNSKLRLYKDIHRLADERGMQIATFVEELEDLIAGIEFGDLDEEFSRF